MSRWIEIKIPPLRELFRLLRCARARGEAHAAFDPLWRSGEMSRNAAYRWLAAELGLPREACHMSNFDEQQCRRVVEVCKRRRPP